MNLLKRLSWWRSQRSLRKARAIRAEALRAVETTNPQADREYGRACMVASQATLNVLRLELGR